MAERRRLLILGGTGEAVEFSHRAAALADLDVIYSLAGLTRTPSRAGGRLRIGGFGGAQGLREFLGAEGIDLVVDATHPYSTRMTRNAAAACTGLNVPRLVVQRPPWRKGKGDRWIPAASNREAMHRLPSLGERIFLTVGRTGLEVYAGVSERCHFLVRLVEPPSAPLPLPDAELVIGRPPHSLDHEKRLLTEHRVDCVVSKNSGGEATYGKIAAARELGLPVVMIQRPRRPDGELVTGAEAAMAWLTGQLG